MEKSLLNEVDLAELKAGLRDGSILLVDVREEPELAGGIIPGSVSMPMSRFDPEALAPAPAQRVVFSCAAGIRSAAAVEISRRLGLEFRDHYPGGFRGWVAAGEPTEPPRG